MTQGALSSNKEWNVEFTSLKEGEMLGEIIKEFDDLWAQADDLCDILPQYEKLYNDNRKFTQLNKITEDLKGKNITLTPNYMQEEFLKNMRDLQIKGENRAILVSATGTGKTYASAFAVHDFKPKRFLFLVHREQILKQSIRAYKHVFEGHENFGLLSEIQRNTTSRIFSQQSRQCPSRKITGDTLKTISIS